MVVTQNGAATDRLTPQQPSYKSKRRACRRLILCREWPAEIEFDIDEYTPTYPAGFRGKKQWLK